MKCTQLVIREPRTTAVLKGSITLKPSNHRGHKTPQTNVPVLQISSKKHLESMSLLKIYKYKYGDESAFISARLLQAWPILSG